MAIIETTDIHKKYGDLEVLKGVSLAIEEKEVVSIVGASGAGKTTLLQIIGTLDQPDKGHVKIKGEELTGLGAKKLARFRNEHIGFVFQFHHLLPEFSALENVCIPAFISGKDKHKTEKRASELLNMLGVRNREDHKPSELSGGEQQRVAVARALINEPAVVLADEPSGNLDSHSADNLHQLMFDLRDKFGQTFVIVTHNKDFAEMADRTLTMKDGNIIY